MDINNILKEEFNLKDFQVVYAPFKKKKRTRASIAKEKGLEKPALEIMYGKTDDVDGLASKYIDEEIEVELYLREALMKRQYMKCTTITQSQLNT